MTRRVVEKTWPRGEDLAKFLHDTLGTPGPTWTHTRSVAYDIGQQEVEPETSRGPLHLNVTKIPLFPLESH